LHRSQQANITLGQSQKHTTLFLHVPPFEIIPLTEQLEFVAELIDVLATLLQSPPNHEKCHKLFVAE